MGRSLLSHKDGAVPFAPLYNLLPDVAKAETRLLLLRRPDGTPGDGYAFMEMFCDDRGCDCRRVVVRVAPTDDPTRALAQISYGWEPESFYRKWASFPLDDDDIEELRGPALMRLNPQSEHADEMLSLFRDLLEDDAYRARIVRHYRMFREIVDAGNGVSPTTPRVLFPGWRSPSRKGRKRK